MIHMNGWRRLGVTLVGLALAGSMLLAAIEWSGKQPGVFVYRMLSAGTTIDVLKNQVVLPDGTAVKLSQDLNGREPWQLDWDKEPDAAPVLRLNWQRVLKLGLLLPLTLWLALEAIALGVGWVVRGFRKQKGADA